MSPEPRFDNQERPLDISLIIEKMDEINARWEIDDPKARNEFELRRWEESLIPDLQLLEVAEVADDIKPRLLAAIDESISLFDNMDVTDLLKSIKSRLEDDPVTEG